MPPTVTLSLGGTELVLPAPRPDATSSAKRLQTAQRTAAGTLVVADSGETRSAFGERFDALSGSEAALLKSFFLQTAQGRRNAFTYTDTDETSRSVRFATAELAVERIGPDLYAAEIVFSEEPPA